MEIAEAYVSADEITPTREAIDLVTKDTAKNEIYEVRSGDTLSVIANNNGLRVAEVLALNEGMSENTVLHEGDEIIITVPEPGAFGKDGGGVHLSGRIRCRGAVYR